MQPLVLVMPISFLMIIDNNTMLHLSANLSSAVLAGVQLRNADLSEANLSEADLSGSLVIDKHSHR
jgi:hypothetical protein